MSRAGLAFICAVVGLALPACDGTGSDDSDPIAAPSTVVGTSPSPTPTFVTPPPPTPVQVSGVPVQRLDVDVDSLEDGPPSRVPWTEFRGNPENGQEQLLHVGKHALPLHSDGYLREVTVWSNGVVWFEDAGLRFLGFDGRLVRLKGVPAWYGRLHFAEDQIFFKKGATVMTVSADDPVPRMLVDPAEVVDVPDEATSVRVTVPGSLGPDDPIWKLAYRVDGERTQSPYYSTKHGALALDPEQALWAAHGVVVGWDAVGRVWTAYHPRTMEPLWSHTYRDGRKQLKLSFAGISPGARHLVLRRQDDAYALVVDAQTGQARYRVGQVPTFEDDQHLVFTLYDGPRNPYFDPNDPEPAPEELMWPNVVVRCSLEGQCERAGRVDAPEKSVLLGTTFLFN